MILTESLRARLPLFYVFLSGVGFSIQSLIIKLSAQQGFQGSFQCVFLRGVVQITLASVYVYYDTDRLAGKGPRLFGDTHWVSCMLFMRSLVGFGSIAFSFLAVELIPMGDAVVLIMLSPLLASILSYFVLGEPWRLPELCGTVLSVIGAVMVAKPPIIFGGAAHHDATFYRGVAFALISACCAALAFIFVRILGTSAKMPWANVCFSQAVGQIVLAVPGLYIAGQQPTLHISTYVMALLLLGGVVGAWSQILMTIGMQREKSAAATAMRMSDVAFGFIWQALFTTDKLSWLSLGGAVLVTCSILIIVVFKQTGAEGIKSVELAQMRSAIHDIADSLSMDTLEESEEEAEEGKRAMGSPSSPGAWNGRYIPIRPTAGGFNYAALRANLDADDGGGGSTELDASAHGIPDMLLQGHGSRETAGGGYATLPQTEI